MTHVIRSMITVLPRTLMIQEEVKSLITVLNLTLMIQEEVKSLILVITVLPQTLMIQEEVSHKLHNNQEVNQQQLVDTFN